MRPYPTPDPTDRRRPVELRYALETFTYRGEAYEVRQAYWFDPTTGKEFTTAPLDDATLAQLHGAHRERHGIPFPEEITRIREQYGMSARGMSEVLGLGVNQYRLYEGGEMPTVPHGKLLRSVDNPAVFAQHLAIATGLPKTRRERARKLIVDLESRPRKRLRRLGISPMASAATGYAMPSLEKVAAAIAILSEGIDYLFSTKLNKLLYYVDMLSFRYYGQAVTGLQYRAIQNGPVPTDYHELFGAISNETIGDVTVLRPEREMTGGQAGETHRVEAYDASEESRAAAAALFSEAQLAVIKLVRQELGFRQTGDLVAYVHEEASWVRHEGAREVIPFGEAFEVRELYAVSNEAKR